jgi:dipeptidyl-peptidase-3
MRFVLTVFLLCGLAPAADNGASVLVERVGDTGFIQLPADSFQTLTARQKELSWWLSEASIAIDPIIYDQLSRFGLRQKALLETIVAHPKGVDPAVLPKVVSFTKLFWANRGNHNELTAQKFLPDFTYEELRAAGLAVLRHRAKGAMTEDQFLNELEPSGRHCSIRPSNR